MYIDPIHVNVGDRIADFQVANPVVVAKIDRLARAFGMTKTGRRTRDRSASGHPAGLNLGDVFSHALAKTRGPPLLYNGDDFARTDIVGAPASG